jgi:hypothetical protein
MPTPTYTLINSVIVGAGGTTSISFTSIPSTYTDLKLVLSGRDNHPSVVYHNISTKFNGSTSGYSSKWLYNLDGTAGSSTGATNFAQGMYMNGAGATASIFTNCELYIPNYASSNNKSFYMDPVVENNSTAVFDAMIAGLWSNTAAITSITLDSIDGATTSQYSTAYLYGIKNS